MTTHIKVKWDTVFNAAVEKETTLEKESAIPFKNAPEWANYYVRNCDGSITYFEHQPEIEWQHYFCNTGRQLKVDANLGYTPSWRKTIRKRPGKVQ
jgi:hypothetical protein